MGDNQKRIKVTVASTNNEFTLVTGELIAKTRDILLDQRRSDIASTTWQMLSENDQRNEVERLTDYAEELVHGIVDVVAAGKFDVIHAKLDNFKIKDGDVTVTSKGRASDGALLALNSVGVKALKIIVADDEQFDQHRDMVTIDADEPDMFSGGEISDGDQYEAARILVVTEQKASTSFIQRRLSIGYNRAAAIVEKLETDGVVSEADHVGKREVLIRPYGGIVDPDTGEILSEGADGDTQERIKSAHAFGRGSYDEHQDADQNPYLDEEDDDLRNAWFAGFYERKNEAEPGGDENSGSDGDGQTAPVESEGEEAPTGDGDSATDQAKTAPETGDGVSDDYTAGLEHRKDDGSRDENPHDGGTQEHSDWQNGYDDANKSIVELFNDGYEAAGAGKFETDSVWKEGTFENARWLIGFERWHQQNNSDE